MATSASALTLFACSGPGGQAAMAQSITMGHYFAVMSGVVVLALVFDHWRMRRVSLRLVAAIFLMAAHPVWTGEASVESETVVKHTAKHATSGSPSSSRFYSIRFTPPDGPHPPHPCIDKPPENRSFPPWQLRLQL